MSTLKELVEDVEKMKIDLYYGNGKENPSITTRLFDIERTLSDFRTMKWLLVGVILTVIGDILTQHVKF